MKYGFVVPNNFGVVDPNQVAALGARAEELGFESVWVNHHVLNVGYVKERIDTKPYHDALTILTWMAANTTKVKLGTSVLVMPYLHPMVLAKQLATLDHLCGGRLIIGLGAGSLPEENAALGAPYETRGKYCNEFLEVLRKLWTEESASFAGEFFSFDNIISSPKPLQQPAIPLMIGGNRPPALRRAARHGDGWHPLGVSPDGVRKRLATIREEASKLRRNHVLETVQVRLDMSRVTKESVADYADAGVTDLVMSINTGDVKEIDKTITAFAKEMF
jgi:probable F420-dependent oxidoreductase